MRKVILTLAIILLMGRPVWSAIGDDCSADATVCDATEKCEDGVCVSQCEPPCENGVCKEDPPGTWGCDCTDTGYEGDQCETDIDECLTNPCDANAKCTNTEGSYTCTCNDGFAGDGQTCTECPNTCENNGKCDLVDGSAACNCTGTGYKGGNCTEDIDECEDGTDSCHADATCTNTEGSYTCACNDGFNGDGKTCSENGGTTLGYSLTLMMILTSVLAILL